MGICCSVSENKKSISDKKESDSLQNTNTALEAQNINSKIKGIPITLDQVNKSIDEWKELTKKRKLNLNEKLTEEKNLFIDAEKDIKICLNELNREGIDIEGIKYNKILYVNTFNNNETLEIDNSNNEINQDFLNINKRINRGFSDMSSTIHFTVLNSKDLASSKLNNKLQSVNYPYNSQSIVNVLDELNNNNNKNVLVNINFRNKRIEKNKILIQNMAYTGSPQNEVKEISLSLVEKSKMTIKKKELPNNSLTHNNIQVNSYFIVNRTHENYFNTIDEDSSKSNNYATILSASLHSNQEFIQENVFYNVDKINSNDLVLESKNLKEKLSNKNNLMLNGLNLPPWDKEIYDNQNFYERKQNNQTAIYLRENIDGMKIEWKKMGSFSTGKSFENMKIIKITQGMSNNCSVIAGLVSISNYDRMFEKNLLHSIIYPYLNKDNYNNNVYYQVKINFNGCSRCLEVDDFMPFNKQSQPFFSKASEIWVNLIEKAIFLLYNGNFTTPSFSIKSNPSYEIYHLTGWIPEIVMFEEITNKSNLWQRLYRNFTEGNIMVNLGTGVLKDAFKIQGIDSLLSHSSYLVQEHSYSVIDVLELSDVNLIKCKNPWGHTLPTIAYDIRNNKTIIDEKDKSELLQEEDNGFFWIAWEKVLEHFSFLFLAWNPEIYPCKYSFVSSKKNQRSTSKFYDESYSLEHNPQYLITIPEHNEDFEVRLLISKHINNLENNNRKKISFKLFWYEGYPIVYPVDHLRTLNPVREVNSDVFIFEASNQVEQYVLVIMKNNQDKQDDDNETFYLDIFSFMDIEVKEMPKRELVPNKSFRFIDNWHSYKPGGNFTSQHFVNNPQYKLNVRTMTHVQIKLETAIATPIMISLIEIGNHVSRMSYDYVINNKNPGFYFNSFSYFECFLLPGEYNVVCVSQEEKPIGKYCLEINTVKNIKYHQMTNQLHDLKVEKLSLTSMPFVEYLKGECSKKNNIGIIENNMFAMARNPGFIFHCPQKTKVKFILKSCNFKINTSTETNEYPNLTIFLYKFEDEDNLSLLLDGRSTTCSPWGFYSDEVELEPNNLGYLVLCVNSNKKYFSKFDLEIHSHNRLMNISSNISLFYKKKNFNVYSKWDKSNSGGGLDQKTFYKNPSYEIIPSKQTEAFFELISHNEFLISIILIEVDQKVEVNNLNDLSNYVIAAFKNSSWKYFQEVFSKKSVLSADKKYFLIPFTKYSNQTGNFDLTISTDEDVSVKEIINGFHQFN